MAAGTWQEGSFFDNLAAAADALGHENVGAAWGLAGIEWASRSDRENFLNALTKVPWNEMQEGSRG